MTPGGTALCTLYEGDYHYGVGALANSLHAAGFDGELWVGTRGERPPWAVDDVHRLPNGLTLRFVDLVTPYHFSHYKPWFMREVLARTGAGNVAYFDPDIVVKAPWSFFSDWFSCGIAVVGDFDVAIGPDHLFRHHWRRFAAARGETVQRRMDRYVNGGLVGVAAASTTLLDSWANLIEGLPELGLPIDRLLPGSHLHPFRYTDQDLLNTALECVDLPLATLPPAAMDLHGQVGDVMCHFTPGAKPWRVGYLRGQQRWRLRTNVVRSYERFSGSPIALYTDAECRRRRWDRWCAATLGRIYSVPGWRP